jgi:hypothetical protein
LVAVQNTPEPDGWVLKIGWVTLDFLALRKYPVDLIVTDVTLLHSLERVYPIHEMSADNHPFLLMITGYVGEGYRLCRIATAIGLSGMNLKFGQVDRYFGLVASRESHPHSAVLFGY